MKEIPSNVKEAVNKTQVSIDESVSTIKDSTSLVEQVKNVASIESQQTNIKTDGVVSKNKGDTKEISKNDKLSLIKLGTKAVTTMSNKIQEEEKRKEAARALKVEQYDNEIDDAVSRAVDAASMASEDVKNIKLQLIEIDPKHDSQVEEIAQTAGKVLVDSDYAAENDKDFVTESDSTTNQITNKATSDIVQNGPDNDSQRIPSGTNIETDEIISKNNADLKNPFENNARRRTDLNKVFLTDESDRGLEKDKIKKAAKTLKAGQYNDELDDAVNRAVYAAAMASKEVKEIQMQLIKIDPKVGSQIEEALETAEEALSEVNDLNRIDEALLKTKKAASGLRATVEDATKEQ